jgi:hypothetical protein
MPGEAWGSDVVVGVTVQADKSCEQDLDRAPQMLSFTH